MELNDYIQRFRSLSRNDRLPQALRARARHLYICLALDFPGAVEARMELLSEAHHKNLKNCGPNVPLLFEGKLVEKLKGFTPETTTPEEELESLWRVFSSLIMDFIEASNSGYDPRDPFCRCECNDSNRSSLPTGQSLYRYIDIDAFENHLLFPGRAGQKPVKLRYRRGFYSAERIALLNSEPSVFNLQRAQSVLLGRPPIDVNGHKAQSVVFLVLGEDAPHQHSMDANVIASRLGLPSLIDPKNSVERLNDGFAILRFSPDAYDPLYRPTILDAHEHQAFRPGPPDSGAAERLKYGWTRVFSSGELGGDNAYITDELGCKELVMPSRFERFPSQALELEAVCFYES